MNESHSPSTQRLKYMLSDLNDHHNLRSQFIDGKNKDYVKFDIWFGGLKNNLTTNVSMEGEVLMGRLHCVVDSDAKKSDVVSVFPNYVEVKSFNTSNKNSTFDIIIHSTKSGSPISAKNYIGKISDVKSIILDADFSYKS
jgi:hypothetical protein